MPLLAPSLPSAAANGIGNPDRARGVHVHSGPLPQESLRRQGPNRHGGPRHVPECDGAADGAFLEGALSSGGVEPLLKGAAR